MNRLAISDKIRVLRKTKGLSQEALAENAGISLRTLQRIECGQADPRGETLRLLAQVLAVPVEELATPTSEPPAGLREDVGFLKLMNLSALCFWFIPLGNIFVPLAFWIYRKNQIQGADELGRRIMHVQIIWTLLTYGGFVMITYFMYSGQLFAYPDMMLAVFLSLYMANTVYIILMQMKIGRGGEKMFGSLKTIQ